MRSRLALAALLVWAAYWSALPWIDCMRAFLAFGPGLAIDVGGPGICTFGASAFGPSGPPPHWLNLLVAAVYLGAAAVVIRRRRTV